MFKKLKLKLAARRVEKAAKAAEKKTENAENVSTGFDTRFKTILTAPVRCTKSVCRKFWNWLKSVDLIAMVNLTLLVMIIVLFSILISNILNCHSKNTENETVVPVTVTTTDIITDKIQPKIKSGSVRIQTKIVKTTITLPLKRNCTKTEDKIRLVKDPKKVYDMSGDVIADGTVAGNKLQKGVRIKGNLYMQNMRTYTLPCDTYIEGNLILRNVNMLKFCGSFTITGNIYVSRNSSFGPIPRTAKLGGQIVF